MGGYHHLISRGVEIAYQQAGKHDKREKLEIEIPTWAPILVAATVAFYFLAHATIYYAFGLLVPTLTMVEAPTATVIRSSIEQYTDEESPDAPLLSKEEKESQEPRVDEEVLILAYKPLTSKFRTIMRHLRTQTGSKHAHWRGFGGFVIYNLTALWAVNIVRSILPFNTCSILLTIPVDGLLCVMSTAWIQQMVAMPGKTYFQRVSELSQAGIFKKLVLPVMAVDVVATAAFMLPMQLATLFNLRGPAAANGEDATLRLVGAALALFTFLFSFFFVVIPLNIGLIRLQASYLNEETAVVVPMDRTLGETETKNLKTAWKSFSRESCRLLVKNYVKYIMVQAALSVFFIMTIAAQMYFIFGSDAVKVIRKKIEEARMML